MCLVNLGQFKAQKPYIRSHLVNIDALAICYFERILINISLVVTLLSWGWSMQTYVYLIFFNMFLEAEHLSKITLKCSEL